MEIPAITTSKSRSSSSSSSSPASMTSSVLADTSASHEPSSSTSRAMASLPACRSEFNNTKQDGNIANGTNDANNNTDTTYNNDCDRQNDPLRQQPSVTTRLRPTAPSPIPVQHTHYESLPVLNLNHPPFYGTFRESTDGVPQYHPFSDDDEDEEEEEEDGAASHFSRTQRVDHAYDDRRDREGHQRDNDEESDSGVGRRRSRWERRRGAVMRMRTAMIWIVALSLLLVAAWICVNLFRKDEGSWDTSKRRK
ncbi:hypothetical protein B0T20DRAFT_385317 [Sordaria brevicollis]|uniref:Uncharacterized protein n=1 Tax=Sordaria brevicollis TaxID=83679 RepID=A0AAE0U5C7_SORBR|nr:hypothetical protein B0T20DRAFT_385317 [Sordaria brevicollis]